jgi:hypothetical protein
VKPQFLFSSKDAVVARQYTDNQSIFRLTAQHWATTYAGANYCNPEYDSLLKRLEDMGVQGSILRNFISAEKFLESFLSLHNPKFHPKIAEFIYLQVMDTILGLIRSMK